MGERSSHRLPTRRSLGNSSNDQKPTIAVDVDDVLFPLVPLLTNFLKYNCDLDIAISDYYTYDFSKVWKMSRSQAVQITESYLASHPLDISPLEASHEVLSSLSARYQLVVVTSRDPSLRGKTEDWVNLHFPGLFDEVVLVGNHYRGGRWKSKGAVCEDLSASFLIDDHPRHIQSAIEFGISTLLFGDYPWQGASEVGWRRAVDWRTVADQLRADNEYPLSA